MYPYFQIAKLIQKLKTQQLFTDYRNEIVKSVFSPGGTQKSVLCTSKNPAPPSILTFSLGDVWKRIIEHYSKTKVKEK
jgi:hypothetical protein